MVKNLLSILVTLFALRQGECDSFVPDSVRLVHCETALGNCIYRGNAPIDESGKGNFVLKKLRDALTDVQAKIPADFLFVDVRQYNTTVPPGLEYTPNR